MDQSSEGQTCIVKEMWIKAEPDTRSTVNFLTKCDESLSIVKIEPSAEPASSTMDDELHLENVSVKSEEITLGDYECIPSTENVAPRLTELKQQQNHIKKRFSCKVCGATCASKTYFLIHQRRHSGERPFLCDECGKGFCRKDILVRHKRFHSGEKPFSCDICGQRFAHKGHIKLHKRTHTGEKPFYCKKCGMKFRQNTNLKRHINTCQQQSTEIASNINDQYQRSSGNCECEE